VKGTAKFEGGGLATNWGVPGPGVEPPLDSVQWTSRAAGPCPDWIFAPEQFVGGSATEARLQVLRDSLLALRRLLVALKLRCLHCHVALYVGSRR